MTGPFTAYASLVEPLPPLVRKQRRLEAKIAAVVQTVKDEKAVRAEIDQFLIAAGLKKGDVVTCLGYDVRHNENAGRDSINEDTLTELLVAGGVDRAFVVKSLAASTETGDPAKFATVTPSKGAKVRT
jgi:hypothetical protein